MILEEVLETLRAAGFRTDLAYPGKILPQIRETVAAVHIRKVDVLHSVMTVEVIIASPEALGGAACELEALRAIEVLGRTGAVCTQNGCSYDSRGQIYTVEILAEYSCGLGPDTQLLIESEAVEYAAVFTAKREASLRTIHEMGEAAAVDASPGPWVWKLRLEEVLPPGEIRIPRYEENFTLTLRNRQDTEVFTGCRWTSEQYEYTAGGLRRILDGIALHKEG